MVYLIWAASFIIGAGMIANGQPAGWVILIGGFLVGSRVQKANEREDQAKRIADKLRE